MILSEYKIVLVAGEERLETIETKKCRKEIGHPLVGALSIQGDGEGKEVYKGGRVISCPLSLCSDRLFIGA